MMIENSMTNLVDRGVEVIESGDKVSLEAFLGGLCANLRAEEIFRVALNVCDRLSGSNWAV